MSLRWSSLSNKQISPDNLLIYISNLQLSVQFTECSVTRWAGSILFASDIQPVVCWAGLRLSQGKLFTIPSLFCSDLLWCLYFMTIWSSQSQQTPPSQWPGRGTAWERPGSWRQLLVTKMTGGGWWWPHSGHSGPGVAGVRNIWLTLAYTSNTNTNPTPNYNIHLARLFSHCLSTAEWWLRASGSHLALTPLTKTNSGNCLVIVNSVVSWWIWKLRAAGVARRQGRNILIYYYSTRAV